jgi:hypothetical protein
MELCVIKGAIGTNHPIKAVNVELPLERLELLLPKVFWYNVADKRNRLVDLKGLA